MMPNEKRNQASASVMVAEDNLKQAETKGFPLQNKKNKIMSTYVKRFAHTTYTDFHQALSISLCLCIWLSFYQAVSSYKTFPKVDFTKSEFALCHCFLR